MLLLFFKPSGKLHAQHSVNYWNYLYYRFAKKPFYHEVLLLRQHFQMMGLKGIVRHFGKYA